MTARKRLPVVLVMTLLLAVIPVVAGAAPPLERVIVVLEAGPGDVDQVAADLAQTHGGTVGFIYRYAIRGFSLSIPAPAIAALRANPQVALVEPDREVSIVQTGTQPVPTGIDRIDADLNPPAQSLANVDIAIIDTGVYLGQTATGQNRSHLDLNLVYTTDCTGAILYPLLGGCTADGNHQDENGHGTHVAGIAAAKDNDIGSIGTAPGATLWSLKALNADGSGYLGGILAAIDLVAANSASIEVANMSFGFEGSAASLDQAITNAVARGVVFVAAAGNSASDATTFSPANHPDVITVSALADFDGLPGGLGSETCRPDVDDTFADFSNFGAPVDIAAPGVCIYSTFLNDGYTTLSGTSMAAPFVTGAVARLIAQTGNKPTNRAEVLALRDALVNAGAAQSSACGFTGDPDASPEPLLFLNSALFGGNGACDSGVPPANVAPMASFTESCTDLSCTFTDGSTDFDGNVASWSWAFGDGATSTSQNPSHSYAAGGSYQVTLTVTDDGGATDAATRTITVTELAPNQPPVASFTYSCTDLACSFNNTSTDPDLDSLTYTWSFGDGSGSTAASPSHTYLAAGTYSVTLTANDGSASDQISQSATVTEPASEQQMSAAVYPILVNGRTATVEVQVLDAIGNGVPDATVKGVWTYRDRRGRQKTITESGVSAADGMVTFLRTFPRGATVETFCVTNVTKSGWTYVPSLITCASPPQ